MEKIGKYIWQVYDFLIDIRIIGGFDGCTVITKGGTYCASIPEEHLEEFKQVWIDYNKEVYKS